MIQGLRLGCPGALLLAACSHTDSFACPTTDVGPLNDSADVLLTL